MSFVQTVEVEATWCYVDLLEQDIQMGDLSTTDVFSYRNLVWQKNTTDIYVRFSLGPQNFYMGLSFS